MTANKNLEQKLRRALNKAGYMLHKSRIRNPHFDDQGGYMITDMYTSGVVRGSRFDYSLEDVQDFVDGKI